MFVMVNEFIIFSLLTIFVIVNQRKSRRHSYLF